MARISRWSRWARTRRTVSAQLSYLTNAEEERTDPRHEQNERLRTEGLQHALANLDARSRRIIEARWLRESDTATLHELADEFGVSAERIRQIEGQAMKKMGASIRHRALDPQRS